MIRSLYTRVVLIFLVSVIGGTLLSFFIATWAFREPLNENLQIPLVHFAQDVARIYEVLPTDEADAFVAGMHQLSSYHIRIYESPDVFRSFGQLDGEGIADITSEEVRRVLSGEKIQRNPNGLTISLVGLPFETKTGFQAIFIDPMGSPSSLFVLKWLLNFSVYALVAGSLVILAAAYFLVRPIQKLTGATRRIAEGHFDVKLDIRQKGELGTLARSFEQMIRELGQLETMRRDFVSNVSHEVQSPLTSISGYAVALKQVKLSEEQRIRYLDIIIGEAGRISKMSDSLLKLSALEAQSPQLRREPFQLDEQLRRVVIALQPQWQERQIAFELDLPDVRLAGDRDQLDQVWTNLIGNAIKFSPDGGQIAIRVETDGSVVTVRVADQGIGIAPEDRERVFERFFKADRARSRKYEGSGLGLAIVKQIVTLQGGEIAAESELGKGTTFVVSLPLDPPN